MPVLPENTTFAEKTKEYFKIARKKINEAGETYGEHKNKRAVNIKTGEARTEKSVLSEVLKCICFLASGIILGSAPLPNNVYPLGAALTLSVVGDKYTFFAFIGSAFSCIGYGSEAAAFFAVNTLCFFSRAFLSSFCFNESVKKRITLGSLIAVLCAVIISAVGMFRTAYIIHGVSYAAGLISACALFSCVIPANRKRKDAVFSGASLAAIYIFVFALSKIHIETFSPAIMLTAFITLYSATSFGSMYGLVSGLVCGIAASSCTDSAFAVAAGIGGFAAGFFGEKKLVQAAISFKLVFSAVVIYMFGTGQMQAVFSAVTASLLFIPASKALPRMALKNRFYETGEVAKTGAGFEKLSSAFTSLSEVVYNISDKLRYPSEREVREKVSYTIDDFCKSCSMYEHCYSKGLYTSKEAENIICDRLMSGGLEKSDLPEKYLGNCLKFCEIIAKLNEGYAQLVSDHFNDNKTEILASEYNTMARLIKYTSQKVKTDKIPDKELYEKANAALAAIGVRYTWLEAYGSRMKYIDVHGVKIEKFPCTAQELSVYMSEKCGYLFGEPEFIGIGEKTILRLSRKRKLMLEYAKSARAKGGSSVNGDCVNFFESDDHYFYALISDGMGSGRSAALTSRLTSVFIEKFLTTGAHKNVTLEMLNNLLLSKNDESFATVDLLEIDLLSGEASFIKAGAAPAYIMRASKLYKIASFTPPAGIIRSFSAENTKFTLEKGDTVMMLSDGIVQSYDEVPWLCELLSCEKGEDPARLSERVLEKAKKINLRDDDMTCVAVTVL